MEPEENRVTAFTSSTTDDISQLEAMALSAFVNKIMDGINPPYRRFCSLHRRLEYLEGGERIEVVWRVEYNPPKE
jgi:hypothetical protein